MGYAAIQTSKIWNYSNFYGAASGSFAITSAAPTDIAQITGSATRIINIHYISINLTATAAVTCDISLVRRDVTVDTGGTATNPTYVKFDSRSPASALAATAISFYAGAANPTIGAATPGPISSAKFLVPTVVTAGTGFVWKFNEGLPPIQLRSATESLCINQAGLPITSGGIMDLAIVWSET